MESKIGRFLEEKQGNWSSSCFSFFLPFQRLFGVGPNASEAAVSLTDDSLRKREEKRKE